MRSVSFKRRWIAAAVLLLLALFFVRPGVSRLKSRIISSISAGVGRPVDIGSVHVRVLPRPGFEIENLVIYDDPMFGAEPMLRASEVTADLRIISLLKGRIDVARLDLTEPSFNLVHRAQGDWNLQALLERAAHNSLAPTGNSKSAPRPHFPYIEGSSGRINFKTGAEKHPYALTNADFSLWQESEDTWGIRLKAQPFRTDLNLTDIGQLQISGTWKRAQSFQETPVELSVEWSKAQLGQLTKLFTGLDKGWRGNIQVDARLTGMPTDMKVVSTAVVDDFRRYDITSGNALRLDAQCNGQYSSRNHEFHDVMCTAPVGEGGLTLSGDIGLPGSGHYAISLRADNVPASAAVGLIQRAKKNIPEDLAVDGILKGTASLERNGALGSGMRFHGAGQIADFRVSSASTKVDLGPTLVPFQLVDDSLNIHERFLKNRAGISFPKGAHIEIGPVGLAAAHSGSATVRGWLSRTSYSFNVSGETEIARVLRLSRASGIPTAGANPEGSTQLNLQIAGSWVGPGGELGIGFPSPEVTGTAKLRNVRAAIQGASEPLEIASADVRLSLDKVQVENVNAAALGAVWTGTLELPRGCGTPDTCSIRFSLTTQELAFTRMGEWIHGRRKSRPWYKVLEPASNSSQLLFGRLHATGQMRASRFVLHGVTANNVSASVRLDSGKLELSGLDADLLNGRHRGKWNIEFAGPSPTCAGRGNVSNVALAKIPNETDKAWLTGTVSGNYELQGPCSADFWPSAEGKFQAEVRNGSMPHVILGDDAGPLVITRLDAQAQLHSGNFEIRSAKLNSMHGTYELSGSVNLDREIDLKMTRVPVDSSHSGYSVTGTLSQPRVSTLANTEQAKLKPMPAK